jgi:predicted DNA-binding transcriptional regulator AlpA
MPGSEVKQRVFSVPQTAIILGRSESSVWRDLRDGRLDSVKIGGSRRVTGESIDRLISNATRNNPPTRP